MQKVLHKKSWAVVLLALLLWGVADVRAYADDGEPMIVLKSSIYSAVGEKNSFQVLLGGTENGYVDVDCGFGRVEYELVPASYDTSAGAWTGTLITCNVPEEGEVKIYGDADKIDVLNATGCYLTSAEFPKLTNLVFLDLSHNELEELDLTPFTKLQSIDVSDNSFTKSPLVVGGNKPNLAILDIGRIEKLDQSFNLSDYPALITFDAWACKGLTRLDPSGCLNLQKISIDSTPVSELDVSNNAYLSILNISDTGIGSIDLSNNVYLTQLYCDHRSGSLNTGTKLAFLDVTKNPNLVYLYANGNNLVDIDLTNNASLRDLYLNNNCLKTINLDNNPQLVNVELRNNYFTFATLPLPKDEWYTYYYNQRAMQVERSQKEGTVLDFSDKVMRAGTTTAAILYKTNENDPNDLVQLGADYYDFSDGKVTLLKAVSDSLYIAFENDAFPETAFYPLCTNKFVVKTAENYGQDDKVISFVTDSGKPLSFGLGMYGATATEPKTFYVDYGDGEKVAYSATSASAPAVSNVAGRSTVGSMVTVYVPENEQVTAFDMEGIGLYSIDLTAAKTLSSLRLVDAGLYSIDLKWNRSLNSLELMGNHFSELDIRGANDAYQKNVLRQINLSNNELKNVTLNDRLSIQELDLSHNQLTELSFKDADNIKKLDLSYNAFSSLDVNYCANMTSLNVANNELTSITLPSENSLESFHCEYNAFDFNTLPVLEGVEGYVYWPQNDVEIAPKAPGVDLSKYNMEDSKTVFTWKKDDGTLLVKGTDYTEEDGKTRFQTPIIGSKVFCEMTNPAYSNLILKTTAIEAAGMPTNVFASFTTTEDGTATLVLTANNDKTPVYIDWEGSGISLEQYMLSTSPTSFTVNTHKDANVKVYSYEEESGITVFSITDAPMSSMDATDLKQLICFTVNGAGLSEIKLPDAKNLYEIYLDRNNFTAIDLTQYQNLMYLTLNGNKLKTFDASLYPKLCLLAVGDNELTSVKLDNSALWSLSLSGNALSDIDLSKVPNIENLALGNNNLSTIDVSGLHNLKVLMLDSNRFKFSTLPLDDNYAKYTYANQAALEAPVVNDMVDLSSEAYVNGTPTSYRWFVGIPSYNDDGELEGDELELGVDYTIENGVTKFLKSNYNVMCVLANDQFPDAVLYTESIDVETTGISNVGSDGDNATVCVVGNDIVVRVDGDSPVRLYGIDGKLVGSAAVVGGEGVVSSVKSGAYIVQVGNTTYKVLVK